MDAFHRLYSVAERSFGSIRVTGALPNTTLSVLAQPIFKTRSQSAAIRDAQACLQSAAIKDVQKPSLPAANKVAPVITVAANGVL